MPAVGVEDQLRAARLEVDKSIQLLVSASPDSLDRCAAILETAGQRVAAAQPQLRAGGATANAREEARRLRTAVARAGRLLEGAASLHFNWNQIRNTLCAGYTPCGAPAQPPPRNRISIQG